MSSLEDGLLVGHVELPLSSLRYDSYIAVSVFLRGNRPMFA